VNFREVLLLGGRGGASDDASVPRPKAAAKGTGAGGDDFEDFPGALEEEDDDLPF
jgi:single-strand DNA-binding protein